MSTKSNNRKNTIYEEKWTVNALNLSFILQFSSDPLLFAVHYSFIIKSSDVLTKSFSFFSIAFRRTCIESMLSTGLSQKPALGDFPFKAWLLAHFKSRNKPAGHSHNKESCVDVTVFARGRGPGTSAYVGLSVTPQGLPQGETAISASIRKPPTRHHGKPFISPAFRSLLYRRKQSQWFLQTVTSIIKACHVPEREAQSARTFCIQGPLPSSSAMFSLESMSFK